VQRWTGFGMRMYQTGAGTPLPTRFPGQIELRASDARIWNGSVTTEFAHALYLNRWRVYDPRVGQYLQPDPEAVDGTFVGEHPFAYVGVDPANDDDPEGRNFRRCLETQAAACEDTCRMSCMFPGPCSAVCYAYSFEQCLINPGDDSGCTLTSSTPITRGSYRDPASPNLCVYTCVVSGTGRTITLSYTCAGSCSPSLTVTENSCVELPRA